MKARIATLHRKTAETDVRGRLKLDGRGAYKISTGIRFLDHMLELFTRHGGFDLDLEARGDLDVRSASHGGGRGHRSRATFARGARFKKGY